MFQDSKKYELLETNLLQSKKLLEEKLQILQQEKVEARCYIRKYVYTYACMYMLHIFYVHMYIMCVLGYYEV